MKAHAEGPPNPPLLFPVSKQHSKACQHTNCKRNLISGNREGSQRLPQTHRDAQLRHMQWPWLPSLGKQVTAAGLTVSASGG